MGYFSKMENQIIIGAKTQHSKMYNIYLLQQRFYY